VSNPGNPGSASEWKKLLSGDSPHNRIDKMRKSTTTAVRTVMTGIVAGATACALACTAARAQGATSPPPSESAIADLKAKSQALASAALARLDALSAEQRLAAPPDIWRVPNAITEFRDCGECPPMVVIPAGDFTMGSPPEEQNAENQHRVTIASPFAVSKFEITFDEWEACVGAGGCGEYRPSDNGWGRDRRPVIHMSWVTATEYVKWLSQKTGKTYTLLSEAEWEYAARAGTTTRYFVGAEIKPDQANFDGSNDGSGPSDLNRQKTLPVGSFPPNAFGLHDMHGNVAEWVDDCWHDQYTADAPRDGSAWLTGNCTGRILRGGSFEDSPEELRSAARVGEYNYNSSFVDGLRIARRL
jgi:formylglycine-generating enzyme required for sulfatase activity